MKGIAHSYHDVTRSTAFGWLPLFLATVFLGISGCAPKPVAQMASPSMLMAPTPAPTPDPRVGLKAGLFDAEEAAWNLELLSASRPAEAFVGETNSDLAFTGQYAIQGNYNGIQVWDISNPRQPSLVTEYVCPASQSDVSVYGNLLFVSGEGLEGRLDCGTEGVEGEVNPDRLRGIRIFDISNIRQPKYLANVQTCRGSHTHSVLKDPKDNENVYIYVSGSAPVRPEEELPGCSSAGPDEDPNSARFRIEVIKVPLAHPEQAAIVSSPRIFEELVAPPEHGLAPDDFAEIEAAKASGSFVVEIMGQTLVLPDQFAGPLLDEFVKGRGGDVATAADSAAFNEALPALLRERFGLPDEGDERVGPDQCHDITLYPEIGLAGGACEGYGLLLDISDPVNPTRMAAVADSNFSYWHSATFNNDGTKMLFSDEWGGGGQPKCRVSDPKEWGADAIFSLNGDQLTFKSYYKLSAAQTPEENCVAHNGSLIPIPGRDVMVQAWYQGGISVFDWTDASNPTEIAYFDRGPLDPNEMVMAGSWSVYWYNGVIVSSEIARGLDVFELKPSGWLSANELAAAKTVKFEYLNAQGQPKFEWPASFALAGAYLDQLERGKGMPTDRISAARQALASAEAASGSTRRDILTKLLEQLASDMRSGSDRAKTRFLAGVVGDLAM